MEQIALGFNIKKFGDDLGQTRKCLQILAHLGLITNVEIKMIINRISEGISKYVTFSH